MESYKSLNRQSFESDGKTKIKILGWHQLRHRKRRTIPGGHTQKWQRLRLDDLASYTSWTLHIRDEDTRRDIFSSDRFDRIPSEGTITEMRRCHFYHQIPISRYRLSVSQRVFTHWKNILVWFPLPSLSNSDWRSNVSSTSICCFSGVYMGQINIWLIEDRGRQPWHSTSDIHRKLHRMESRTIPPIKLFRHDHSNIRSYFY